MLLHCLVCQPAHAVTDDRYTVRLYRQRGAVAQHADSHPTDDLGLHLPLAPTGPLTAAGTQVCAGHGDHAFWAAHLQLWAVAAGAAEEAWQAQGSIRERHAWPSAHCAAVCV
jgi:hypothetical protein